MFVMMPFSTGTGLERVGGHWAKPGLMLDRSTCCASLGLGYDCCCADRHVLNAARLCKKN